MTSVRVRAASARSVWSTAGSFLGGLFL